MSDFFVTSLSNAQVACVVDGDDVGDAAAAQTDNGRAGLYKRVSGVGRWDSNCAFPSLQCDMSKQAPVVFVPGQTCCPLEWALLLIFDT